jgi:cell shape-determining protein MreC
MRTKRTPHLQQAAGVVVEEISSVLSGEGKYWKEQFENLSALRNTEAEEQLSE